MHRLLIGLSLTACTATVRTVGPPPNEPPPPPPSAAPAPAPAPAPTPAVAVTPAPNRHPHYIEALADLRLARAYLERPAGVVSKWDEKKAIYELDLTIREINEAAINDGKNVNDHPPVDVPTWGGRLQRSLELCEKARADVNMAEDNPSNRLLKAKVLKHLDTTEAFIQAGIADAKTIKEPPPAPPPAAGHPAYTAAIGNLRQARALLERPAGGGDVKWDEKHAIHDVDEALEEIHRARVDDGRPNTEHAPIENGLVYRDRLRQAEKLLGEAAKDIEQREDNTWAKGDRHRAVEAINRAAKAVQEAIADRREDKAERKEEKREEKAEKHGH